MCITLENLLQLCKKNHLNVHLRQSRFSNGNHGCSPNNSSKEIAPALVDQFNPPVTACVGVYTIDLHPHGDVNVWSRW